MKKNMRIQTVLFTVSMLMALTTSCNKNVTYETTQGFPSDTINSYTTHERTESASYEVDSVTTIQSTVRLTTQTEIFTEAETILVTLPEFKYQPPESVNDIFWYSDYKEFEILYTFYPNDEHITNYLPKEIVDDLTEYVSERIDLSIENIGFFGVTMYDINDDGTNDYLVTARALPIPYITGDNDSLYTLYIRDYPAVFLENSNGYDFIPRATTKFNSIHEDTNDGFVMSTKTNGLKDIFLEVQEGFRITYDDKSEYLPESINYSNVFGESELLNNSLCKFTLKPTNCPISYGGDPINDYYVCVKFNENNNPFKENIIYTCNMAGEAVYYRSGYPINEDITDPFKQGNFVFYIPIKNLEAYKDFEENRIIDILEVKYIDIYGNDISM